jgi:hypothetical protein
MLILSESLMKSCEVSRSLMKFQEVSWSLMKSVEILRSLVKFWKSFKVSWSSLKSDEILWSLLKFLEVAQSLSKFYKVFWGLFTISRKFEVCAVEVSWSLLKSWSPFFPPRVLGAHYGLYCALAFVTWKSSWKSVLEE